MKLSARCLLGVVMLCLFISGMAGLVYEIVWTRYLALFLGHTSYAVVAILVAFMGGLALGNAWIGALADRTRRPLACYAWLEIGIGLYALVFPPYYSLCYDLFLGAARHLAPGSAGLLALKFGFSLTTVLLPTMLMGGTLPLLTRLVTRSLGELREKIAALYFINSAGAVVGAWLADFWLLESIGLEATIVSGAVMNLAVGALALFVSSWLKEGQSEWFGTGVAAASEPEGPTSTEESFSAGELRLAVIGIGLSGFVAMLYQVVWTRLLALALGSSTHAFSLMLITFIAGITVGSWIIYRWKNLRQTLAAFAWTELALAGTLAGSMFLYQYLPHWFAKLAELLDREPDAYPVYELAQGLICVGVMFIPTVCLGMTLPLVSRVATAHPGSTGRSVGRVFAINTLGTVLGAGFSGLWLLPKLGLARTFALGVGLNALIGLAILLHKRGPRWRMGLVALPFLIAAAVWWSGQHFNPTWRAVLTMGMWRQGGVERNWATVRETIRLIKLLYYKDGAGSTVSVHELEASRTNRFLKVNGKTEASTMGDLSTQVLVAHVPLLLQPSAQDVLIVGLGSGVTAGAAGLHSSVRRLDVVEISPEVVQAAPLFADANLNVLADRRLNLVLEDAKSFLQMTDRKYHVVISEPSNPWMAGVAGVFSVEFYRHCLDHLAPGGLMVQWVQLYEFSDGGLDMVVATFAKVFPYISVWRSHRSDLLLIGSATPLKVDLNAFIAGMAEPKIKADLERIHLANVPLLLAQEIISPQNGAFLPAEGTRVHSDFFPTLEYLAQRDFFARPAVDRHRQLDETFSRRPATLLGRYLKTHPLTQADYQAFTRYYLSSSSLYLDLFASLLLRWQQEDPEAFEPLEVSTRFKFLAAPAQLDVLRLAGQRDRLFERAERDPTLLRHYALSLMRTYRDQRSAFYGPPTGELEACLGRLMEVDATNERVYYAYLAELAWDREEDDQCLALGDRALGPLPPGGPANRGAAKFKLDVDAPLRIVTCMADILWRRGQLAQAAAICEVAIQARYLNDRTRPQALPFEAARRRIQTALANQGGAAPGGPGPSPSAR